MFAGRRIYHSLLFLLLIPTGLLAQSKSQVDSLLFYDEHQAVLDALIANPSLNDEDPWYLLRKSMALARLRMTDSASFILNSIQRTKLSDFHRALYSQVQGVISYRRSQFGASLNSFQKAGSLLSGRKEYAAIYAEVLYWQALANRRLQNLNDFEKLALESLVIYNQDSVRNRHRIASVHNSLGIYYQDYRGNPKKGLEQYEKALSLYLQVYGKDHPRIASMQNNIGTIFHDQNNYLKARDYYLSSLETKTRILGPQDIQVASTFNNLGLFNNDYGNYFGAIEYYLSALSIYEEYYDESQPEMAQIHINIGALFANLGNYESSSFHYNESFKILQRIHGNSHIQVADVHRNIGDNLVLQSSLIDAKNRYLKAMSIYLEILEADHQKIAETNILLGNIYLNKENIDLALDYFQQAHRSYQKNFSSDHPRHADLNNSIAQAMIITGDLDSAKVLLRTTLEIFEKHDDIVNQHKTLLSLSRLSESEGDLYSAINYLEEALAIVRRNPGGNRPKEIVFCNELAYINLIAGDVESADSWLTEAFAMHGIETPVDNNLFLSDLIFSFQIAGWIRERQGKYKEAIQVLQEGVKLLKLLSSNLTTGPRERSLREIRSKLHGSLVRAYFRDYQQSKSQGTLNEVFASMGRAKSESLISSILESEARKYSGIPDSLINLEADLRNRMSYLEIQIDQEMSYGESMDSTLFLEYQDEYFDYRQQYQALVSHFENNYPRYFELKHNWEVPSVEDLQSDLDKEKVIVEFFQGDSAIYIGIISHKDQLLLRLELGNIERELHSLRNNIQFEQSIEAADSLYSLLWNPVEKQLRSMGIRPKRVIIIPHEYLYLLPFEVLRDNSDYLVERYNISYAYSTDLWYKQNQIRSGNQWIGEILAVAPVFTRDSVDSSGQVEKLAVATRSLDSLRSPGKDRVFYKRNDQMVIEALPATEAEVNEIREIFANSKNKSVYLLHNEATESNLKNSLQRDFRMIHLATHGIINEDHPELSGLVLTPDTTSSEDGLLYTNEIYNLEINSDLVTLSACDTGLGRLLQGEGVIGLTRGFLYAGASNVLVSLWKVTDESTAEFMQEFYSHLLKGKSKPEALRKAKLKMIKSEKYSHPYYWAPFVLIGR